MPPALTVQQRESALCQLWSNRAQLTQAQWAELYDHVVFGLSHMCRAPQLQSLGDTREEHIQQFFLVKAYEGDYSAGWVPYHFGALCDRFQQYLLDILKSPQHTRVSSLDDCGDDDEPNQLAQDMAVLDQSEQLLFESGLSETTVRTSASDFLASLEKPDQIYLACHQCADQEESEPISKLAKRMQIASSHYRALKLGITRKKGEFEIGYEETSIGTWLTRHLGLQCTREYVQEILVALKILCDESLKRYRHLCAGGNSGANHG